MFGKEALPYEQISEDEDWGPAKKRRREKESDAASTLMTLYESDKKCSDVDVGEVERKLPQETRIRRSFFRIPHNAVEVVKLSFSLNLHEAFDPSFDENPKSSLSHSLNLLIMHSHFNCSVPEAS